MAYLLYEVTPQRWKLIEKVRLFGFNALASILREKYAGRLHEPLGWHVGTDDFRRHMAQDGQQEIAVVVDLRPQGKTVDLYRLTDIWGFSHHGWTPIMLRLEGLFIEADPQVVSKEAFAPPNDPEPEVAYTFTYLQGSVRDGELVGKWTPPPPVSANSCLLWPEPIQYFIDQIRQRDPWFIR